MRKLTTKEFIEKAKQIHGDKYDYSKVEYINNSIKVCIICPEHGEFWQNPNSHLRGSGCCKCANFYKPTTEEFIEKAQKIHGNKYDYSKVNYINSHTKICIICSEHGEFLQTPYSHLNGCGCPKCGMKIVKTKISNNKENFIERSKLVHRDKYDYSKVEYVNEKTKVKIICKIHGEFEQIPWTHINGAGCPFCKNEKLSKERMMSNEEFIEKSKKIHYNKYSYDFCEYNGYYKKVKITCPIHGNFEQLAYNHIQGKGCPKCRRSKMEIEIEEFLKENNINYISQYRNDFLINGKSRFSLDFYLPDYKIAIECQGAQHFIGNTFYSKNINEIIKRDLLKKELCEKNNIKLIYYTIYEKFENKEKNLYINKNDILNYIKNEGLLQNS